MSMGIDDANCDLSNAIDGEAMMRMIEEDYQDALQKCQEGKSSEELRLLSLSVRNVVRLPDACCLSSTVGSDACCCG